ncbi:hypothetical protein BEN49_04740 [Hymenobacter coccineus]|uniref:Uncharacterized protein n=1 Tax=Hymenobacter coccineus TaxID=1908235 RepID=A0A1G1TKS7_9BACT|nr:hypothetical protein BEN49_04740 [Hymenobacter coccineus]
MVPPTLRNRKSARLLLRSRNAKPALFDLPRHFTKEQVAVLAELLFNPSFNKSFTQVQAKLLTQWARSPRAHLWLELILEKGVTVKANGISFKEGDDSYFWVTSLFKRSNYFCFNKLKYTSLDDHRPGRTRATADFHAELDRHRLRAHIKLNAPLAPVQDSSQAGSSLYGTPEVALLTDDEVALPSIERTAKVLQETVTESTYRHVYGRPTVLSERGGGRDLDVAKAFFHLEQDKVTYAWYFRAIVAELRRNYSVRCLEVNNAARAFDPGVCVLRFLTRPPYRVAIAEVLHQRRYYYFFQVLASQSRRWAFLFTANNQVALSADQINGLMLAISKSKDDWVLAKKKYLERLSRWFDDALTIIPHNRKGIVSDVKRCKDDMQNQFRIKRR